ncbi:MAG: hypothetical protein Q4B54_08865 [Coriobacteriales bacterium]|nr:hypothetical protein [Coriobacteriales bacterium]
MATHTDKGACNGWRDDGKRQAAAVKKQPQPRPPRTKVLKQRAKVWFN